MESMTQQRVLKKRSYLVTRHKWKRNESDLVRNTPFPLPKQTNGSERDCGFSWGSERKSCFESNDSWQSDHFTEAKKSQKCVESLEGGILRVSPTIRCWKLTCAHKEILAQVKYMSLVGCGVLIFHSVDCYYLWKLPPTGKYSWKQVKRCQEAVSLLSKNHVIVFFFFLLQMNLHEIILGSFFQRASTSCNISHCSLRLGEGHDIYSHHLFLNKVRVM